MDEKTYLKEALRTDLSIKQYKAARCRLISDIPIGLTHAILGTVTEAGELADLIKRTVFYGKPFDAINAIEEFGDLFWYINLAINELAALVEIPAEELIKQIRELNIAKLRQRFPDKFEESDAVNRDTYAERMILEGRCPKCGHAKHGKICVNAASDNDCNCTYGSK